MSTTPTHRRLIYVIPRIISIPLVPLLFMDPNVHVVANTSHCCLSGDAHLCIKLHIPKPWKVAKWMEYDYFWKGKGVGLVLGLGLGLRFMVYRGVLSRTATFLSIKGSVSGNRYFFNLNTEFASRTATSLSCRLASSGLVRQRQPCRPWQPSTCRN